jgi:CheY-like chemotaxis protein
MDDHVILVVDDDPLLTIAVSASLELRGFPARTAANGSEALEMVQELEPSLVLLDLHMPVLDGRGFMEALRARGKHLTVVVMSSDPDLPRVAEELGAVAYLPKPFAPARLTSMVSSFVPAA